MSKLEQFLAKYEVIATEFVSWGEIQLREESYLLDELPPDEFISSVRCIVRRGGNILVVQGKTEEYIVPGGRRETGESVIETLERELLEEVGWTVQNRTLLGIVRFQHLTPKPVNYRYPYPDFLWLIYEGEAADYRPEAMEEDEHVLGSEFRPLSDPLPLNPNQMVFLETIRDRYLG
ncbi:MAG: NUDIX domain-containing protein [Chloroflexota bacterium]